jgi:hypothetical protein
MIDALGNLFQVPPGVRPRLTRRVRASVQLQRISFAIRKSDEAALLSELSAR